MLLPANIVVHASLRCVRRSPLIKFLSENFLGDFAPVRFFTAFSSRTHNGEGQHKEFVMSTTTLKIADVAADLGLSEEKVTLPNGREVMSIVWKPSHLADAFRLCGEKRAELGDSVVIDGACPTWLLPTITDALSPAHVAVKYPQGGPDATLSVTKTTVEGAGSGQDINFTVTEGDATTVEFALTSPQVDAQAVLGSLVAPEVPSGKAVRISGRGPIAIAAALAKAYADRVPSVSCFQPGTGHVTCISRDDSAPLGTVSN